MAIADLARVVAIDVSERGSTVYAVVAGHLILRDQPWQRQRRSADQWQPYIEEWKVVVERGGAAIGAYTESGLVGIAVVRYQLTRSTAQLVALFVDRAHRRQGIATALTHEIIRLAQAHEAQALYVSATPSESAVGFYMSRSFTLAVPANRELYAREPEDIHMQRSL